MRKLEMQRMTEKRHTSILRNTHTHVFANELQRVNGKHPVDSHSPAAVLVCVYMSVRSLP